MAQKSPFRWLFFPRLELENLSKLQELDGFWGGSPSRVGAITIKSLKKMDVRYFSGQLLPSLLLYAMLFPLAPFSRDHSSLQTAEAVKSDQQCSFRYIIYIYIYIIVF